MTNDFPPKVGGIQSYLWELWRRLPPERTTVLTASHDGAAVFDADQGFRIERAPNRVLLPTRKLVRRIDRLADEVGAGIVLLDPVLPLGRLGPRLGRPYGLVAHGAEVAVPGRLPLLRSALARVSRGARLVVAAGGYPAAELERAAGRALPTVVVPPGVDVGRFSPRSEGEKAEIRRRLGLPVDAALVVSVSRLVPRKGMDVLIEAMAALGRSERPTRQGAPSPTGRPLLVIAGAGRDRRRLERLARSRRAPVRFVGRIDDAHLSDLLGCADVFAMLCRDRWGGLEQEGFGIVFLEAAAAGLPSVAGRSGGSHEAVAHGETGLVVDEPTSTEEVVRSLRSLLDDPDGARRMGAVARRRVEGSFSYERLAIQLQEAIEAAGSSL